MWLASFVVLLLLEKAAIFEIVLDDDVRDGVEDELDVGRVRSAGEVRVDLLLVAAFVQALELHLDVSCAFLVRVRTYTKHHYY